MINSLKIKGLNNERDIDLIFNNNVNLLTGNNGCGKTTILKILWYLTSPNVERIFGDIAFDQINFQCSQYSVELSGKAFQAEYTPIIGEPITVKDKAPAKESLRMRSHFPSRFEQELEEINDAIRKLDSASLFFPTYRRIEERKDVGHGEFDRLDTALEYMVKRISVDNHKLIASLSTQDIRTLITEKYADSSDLALNNKEALLEVIVKEVEGIQKETETDPDKAIAVLNEIVQKITASNEAQQKIFQAFASMQIILSKFINDKTVEINKNLSLGEIDRVISSEKLSSGEKQLLSFLAYNAFYSDIPILIDEPELSLHPDWQRMLVPALESQGTNNQLIMATHSPFIYSKYPESELRIGNH